jgi:hypothetical protein
MQFQRSATQYLERWSWIQTHPSKMFCLTDPKTHFTDAIARTFGAGVDQKINPKTTPGSQDFAGIR